MKTFITLAVLTLLIASGIFFWLNPGAFPSFGGGEEPAPVATTTPQDTRTTYASSTAGFSVRYPSNFTLDSAYAYPFSDAKPIGGVRFTIPAAVATGTNLSPDSYVSVEQLPRANACAGDIYVRDNVRASVVVEGGVEYSMASTSEATAGNRYEEIVYAFPDSKPCTAVRYFIHYGAIENYPAGVREFDRAALLASFDEIRRSVVLSAAASAPAATTTSAQ